MKKSKLLLIGFMVFGSTLYSSEKEYSKEQVQRREVERDLFEPNEEIRPSLIGKKVVVKSHLYFGCKHPEESDEESTEAVCKL